MTPLVFYATLAALFGFSIHKGWFGLAAFALAMMFWILLIQTLSTYMMHPSLG